MAKWIADDLPVDDLIDFAKLADRRAGEIANPRRKDVFKNLRDAAFLAAVVQGGFECGVDL